MWNINEKNWCVLFFLHSIWFSRSITYGKAVYSCPATWEFSLCASRPINSSRLAVNPEHNTTLREAICDYEGLRDQGKALSWTWCYNNKHFLQRIRCDFLYEQNVHTVHNVIYRILRIMTNKQTITTTKCRKINTSSEGHYTTQTNTQILVSFLIIVRYYNFN